MMNIVKNFNEFSVNESLSPLDKKLQDAIIHMLYGQIRELGLGHFDCNYEYLDVSYDPMFVLELDVKREDFHFTVTTKDWNKEDIQLGSIVMKFPFDNKPMKVYFEGLVDTEEIYDSNLFTFDEINEKEKLIELIDE